MSDGREANKSYAAMRNEAKLLNGCRFLLPFVLSNVQRKKNRGITTRKLKETNEMAKQIVLVRECVGHIATD